MRDKDYEPENYHCKDCKYYLDKCKRINKGIVDFVKPTFLSAPDFHIVCCDFELKDYLIYAKKNWIDFNTFWKEYVENWLPYSNENILTYFTLYGNTNVEYGVKLLDFVYNRMWDGNKLKAVEKLYYKKTRSGFGYKLIHEPIDGIEVDEKLKEGD